MRMPVGSIGGDVKAGCLLILALLGACDRRPALADLGDIRVLSGYSYPPAGDNAAAYLQIQNRGGSVDTMVEVRGPDFGHGMVMGTADEQMTDMGALVIPAGQKVSMAPGGIHLMLEGVTRSSRIGDSLPLVLRFARAGEASITVPVVPYGEMPE